MDARSDVYAVGAIAYVILTGFFPREGIPPNKANPKVDPALSDWVMSAMNRDRDKRPQDAVTLLNSLDDFPHG